MLLVDQITKAPGRKNDPALAASLLELIVSWSHPEAKSVSAASQGRDQRIKGVIARRQQVPMLAYLQPWRGIENVAEKFWQCRATIALVASGAQAPRPQRRGRVYLHDSSPASAINGRS